MTQDPPPFRDELTARERYALLVQGLLVVGSVPDTAVALVRWVRRERGVQLGPTLATLLLSAALPRLGRAALRTPGRRGVAARGTLALAVPVLPVLAGTSRATVVGQGHPLWQLAVSATVRVVGACVTVLPVARTVARRRRERLSAG